MSTNEQTIDDLRFALTTLGVAMNGLEPLRPLHYGMGVDHTHRDPPKLSGLLEHLVREALATLPMLVTELEKELTKRQHKASRVINVTTAPPIVHVACATCARKYHMDRDKVDGRTAQFTCSHCGAILAVRGDDVTLVKPGIVGALNRCCKTCTDDAVSTTKVVGEEAVAKP